MQNAFSRHLSILTVLSVLSVLSASSAPAQSPSDHPDSRLQRALWNQSLAGGGGAINAWRAAHGFDSTRVNSRTPGREANREAYGWGQTTPREMTRLLTLIRTEQAVSKQGAVAASRSEVVLVNAPSGDYVFCPRYPWSPAPGARQFKPHDDS